MVGIIFPFENTEHSQKLLWKEEVSRVHRTRKSRIPTDLTESVLSLHSISQAEYFFLCASFDILWDTAIFLSTIHLAMTPPWKEKESVPLLDQCHRLHTRVYMVKDKGGPLRCKEAHFLCNRICQLYSWCCSHEGQSLPCFFA